MASDGGIQRGWSDLPDDLLDTVYLSCFTAYDRTRFAAVCASWRAVASWHPPLPALPLLLPFTGNGDRDRQARAYSPEDGRALRVPLPRFALGSHWQLLGSHEGGWIIGASKVDCEIMIVNPFSGAQVRLPLPVTDESTDLQKIIFSDDPTSSGCIAAAIIGDCAVGLCRIDCPELGWMTRGLADYPKGYDDDYLDDILFYNGELYGLKNYNGCKRLLKFDTALNKDGALKVTSVHRLANIDMTIRCLEHGEYYLAGHIFELHSKLAMAVEFNSYCNDKETHFVRVYQLVHEAPHRSVWVEVTSLGDCALFVGELCCKAVHVSSRRGTVEKNHIYHSKQRRLDNHCKKEGVSGFTRQFLKRLDLGNCHVYHCEKDDGVHPPSSERITSRGYHHYIDVRDCLWLLPPDF